MPTALFASREWVVGKKCAQRICEPERECDPKCGLAVISAHEFVRTLENSVGRLGRRRGSHWRRPGRPLTVTASTAYACPPSTAKCRPAGRGAFCRAATICVPFFSFLFSLTTNQEEVTPRHSWQQRVVCTPWRKACRSPHAPTPPDAHGSSCRPCGRDAFGTARKDRCRRW